jgi:ketosteroid isomerase-like protein
MAEHPADEVLAAAERYVEVRERIERGESDWSEFVELFTDDAVFVDPAWGRVEGRSAIRELFDTAMPGVDFSFPIDFWTTAGDWVGIKWRQVLPRTRPDGTHYQQSAVSTLLYGGGGRFRYEEDLLNMAHAIEDIVASGWTPGDGFTAPPETVDRNFDPEPTGG